MYQLTNDPDCIINLGNGAWIPRGHPLWDEYEAWLAEGNTPAPDPSTIVTEAQRNEAIRQGAYAWMDAVVQTKDYDNIYTCASYANSTIEQFKADANALIAWRDAVVLALYALQADPPAGVDTWAQVQPLLPQPEEFGW